MYHRILLCIVVVIQNNIHYKISNMLFYLNYQTLHINNRYKYQQKLPVFWILIRPEAQKNHQTSSQPVESIVIRIHSREELEYICTSMEDVRISLLHSFTFSPFSIPLHLIYNFILSIALNMVIVDIIEQWNKHFSTFVYIHLTKERKD